MRSRRVTYAPQAITDLRDIQSYIADDNPDRSITFLAELRSHIRDHADKGLIGVARPDFGEAIRSIPHGNYIILFRVTDATLNVLHVFGASRDVLSLLGAPPNRQR